MAPQYSAPAVPAGWAESRETHIAVATAIFGLSHITERTPDAIWQDPTQSEWDHVTMAIENYIANGVFSAEPDGRYAWGEAVIELEV